MNARKIVNKNACLENVRTHLVPTNVYVVKGSSRVKINASVEV